MLINIYVFCKLQSGKLFRFVPVFPVMSIGQTLQQWLSKRSKPVVIRECRDCGRTLADDTFCCSNCGSSSIAHYEIP
ncbi:hypothetical protein BRC82_06805 [Halobacteriales archaeon QS_1_67_19]|nr:MAG: hypothetical protein BRC82_06805 [Halobacteriales archaeon QS_1_67_19]